MGFIIAPSLKKASKNSSKIIVFKTTFNDLFDFFLRYFRLEVLFFSHTHDILPKEKKLVLWERIWT